MHTRCSLSWLRKQEFSFTCPIKMWTPHFRLPYVTVPLEKTPVEWCFFFPVIWIYVWSGCKTFEEQIVLYVGSFKWHNPLSCSLSIIYFMFVCNLSLLCEASLSQPLPLPHLQLLKQRKVWCSSVQDLPWDLEILYSDSSFAMMFAWHHVLCYICMVFSSWDKLRTCCVYCQNLVEMK